MSGVMVSSAIGASGLSYVTGTLVAGVAGALLGVVLAYMALRFRADQVIVGVVLVAFATGLTQFIYDQVLSVHQDLNAANGALPIAMPALAKIPVIGPILFDQTAFVYGAILRVALLNVLLFRTRFGLRVRSVGEKPRASETVGLNVVRLRYAAVALSGFIAGIGGAYFTIGTQTAFSPGMDRAASVSSPWPS
jgi:simple sugar transport system permease protein